LIGLRLCDAGEPSLEGAALELLRSGTEHASASLVVLRLTSHLRAHELTEVIDERQPAELEREPCTEYRSVDLHTPDATHDCRLRGGVQGRAIDLVSSTTHPPG
jgi:hypothetical protein